MEFTVGQKVYYVPRYGNPQELEITKVGRKWAYLSGDGKIRFDPVTRRADGGSYSSPGTVWLSEVEYSQAKALDREWARVSGAVRNSYNRPKHITAEDLATMAAILRVPPPTEDAE